MRAVAYATTGSLQDVLKLHADFPNLTPPTGAEILVKVTHAALEPGDIVIMSLVPFALRKRPAVPSLEFAGTIEAAGPDAAPEFRTKGVEVLGTVPLVSHIYGGVGTLVEYVKTLGAPGSSLVVLKPRGMPAAEAAGLMGSGSTALALVNNARVGPGDVVLVNGASGAVGTQAVQIAKNRGARVVAVCSAANAQLVKSLGADEVIDYRAHTPLHAELARRYRAHPFDAILDTVGTQTLFEHCPLYLKPDGAYANIGAYVHGPLWTFFYVFKNWFLPRALGGVPRRYLFWSTRSSRAGNEEMVRWLEEGRLRVVVDEEYELEDFARAFARLESKRARGKIIIKI